MDETKGTTKDPLQPTGQASEGDKGITPKAETKTYTQEDVNRAIEKAKNDALAAAGRDAKTLAQRQADLDARDAGIKAQQAEIDDIKRQRDAAELEEARRDPSKLTAYQARKAKEQEQQSLQAEKEALKKDRAAFERDKAEHTAAIQAAQEMQLEIDVWEIGAEFGINPVTLKDTMKDLNLTTAEQAKALAKSMKDALKRPAETEGETKPEEEFNPASGVTSGIGANPTNEQLDKASMEEYAALRKKDNPKQL
jgi:hypothetical protein